MTKGDPPRFCDKAAHPIVPKRLFRFTLAAAYSRTSRTGCRQLSDCWWYMHTSTLPLGSSYISVRPRSSINRAGLSAVRHCRGKFVWQRCASETFSSFSSGRQSVSDDTQRSTCRWCLSREHLAWHRHPLTEVCCGGIYHSRQGFPLLYTKHFVEVKHSVQLVAYTG